MCYRWKYLWEERVQRQHSLVTYALACFKVRQQQWKSRRNSPSDKLTSKYKEVNLTIIIIIIILRISKFFDDSIKAITRHDLHLPKEWVVMLLVTKRRRNDVLNQQNISKSWRLLTLKIWKLLRWRVFPPLLFLPRQSSISVILD